MSVIPEDPTGEVKPVKRDGIPDARAVNDFHTNDDVNKTLEAHHHTLGISRNKASSGVHKHTGVDSRKVGFQSNLAVSGSKGGNAALASLITMLQKVIDFQDNTT